MNYLDKIAENYHTSSHKDKFIEDECQMYTLDWINNYIKDDLNVLELGYGEGVLTNYLSGLKINLDVVEGSKVLVEKGQILHPNIVFHHSFFEDFFPIKKYDLIVCTHVLEHVDNPSIILDNLYNWLAENGTALIIVPNSESIHRQLAVIMNLQKNNSDLSERDHLVGHKRVYDYKQLDIDIYNSSLEVIKREGFFLKTLPNSMMLNFDKDLIKALNAISSKLPFNLLANLAYEVKKSK
jgi:2-polyprenyl-3-methyl-5-hydroxy-6-metoxy-1,4-benzoquinol methylase